MRNAVRRIIDALEIEWSSYDRWPDFSLQGKAAFALLMFVLRALMRRAAAWRILGGLLFVALSLFLIANGAARRDAPHSVSGGSDVHFGRWEQGAGASLPEPRPR